MMRYELLKLLGTVLVGLAMDLKGLGCATWERDVVINIQDGRRL
jgi:hypothetical protein